MIYLKPNEVFFTCRTQMVDMGADLDRQVTSPTICLSGLLDV